MVAQRLSHIYHSEGSASLSYANKNVNGQLGQSKRNETFFHNAVESLMLQQVKSEQNVFAHYAPLASFKNAH